jgi:hypothetical protein
VLVALALAIIIVAGGSSRTGYIAIARSTSCGLIPAKAPKRIFALVAFESRGSKFAAALSCSDVALGGLARHGAVLIAVAINANVWVRQQSRFVSVVSQVATVTLIPSSVVHAIVADTNVLDRRIGATFGMVVAIAVFASILVAIFGSQVWLVISQRGAFFAILACGAMLALASRRPVFGRQERT